MPLPIDGSFGKKLCNLCPEFGRSPRGERSAEEGFAHGRKSIYTKGRQYPNDFVSGFSMRTLVKHVLKAAEPSDSITIKGWVRTRRDSKGFSFLEVNDGSCLANLQVVIDDGT